MYSETPSATTISWHKRFHDPAPSIMKHPGFHRFTRPKQTFCSGSTYLGYWNKLGTSGQGTYTFPHEVFHDGKQIDGQFHGDGTLVYPMGQKLEGLWTFGRLLSWEYIYADGLHFDGELKYCKYPDRRFHTGLQNKMKMGRAEEFAANKVMSRDIPKGCYDAGDGFYNPKTKCVVSPDLQTILRIPTAAEEQWIKRNCRKSWDESVGYRPDLYAQWVTGRANEKYVLYNDPTDVMDDSWINLSDSILDYLINWVSVQ